MVIQYIHLKQKKQHCDCVSYKGMSEVLHNLDEHVKIAYA